LKAPEVLQNDEISKWGDIFSLGIIMWQISHNQLDAYPQLTSAMEAKSGIIEGNRPIITETMDTKLSTVRDTTLIQLIDQLATQCWEKDPAKRPTMKQISSALQKRIVNSTNTGLETTTNDDQQLYFNASENDNNSTSEEVYFNQNIAEVSLSQLNTGQQEDPYLKSNI
jgi:hypothetical protein